MPVERCWQKEEARPGPPRSAPFKWSLPYGALPANLFVIRCRRWKRYLEDIGQEARACGG